MYSSKEEAKQNNWFSRRHQTETAHNESRRTSRDRRRNRQKQADERAHARSERTDEQQLQILAARGITSGREFDRLMTRIHGDSNAKSKV